MRNEIKKRIGKYLGGMIVSVWEWYEGSVERADVGLNYTLKLRPKDNGIAIARELLLFAVNFCP